MSGAIESHSKLSIAFSQSLVGLKKWQEADDNEMQRTFQFGSYEPDHHIRFGSDGSNQSHAA